jgi:hypothetical protein
MDGSVTIASRDPGARLTLRPDSRDYFIAELSHQGLSASIRVSSYLSHGLGDYFGEIATNWTGWPGERAWSSLEGELAVRATSDRTGHVYLTVALRRESPAQWHLEARLTLEAGQLERIALAVRAFERSVFSVP